MSKRIKGREWKWDIGGEGRRIRKREFERKEKEDEETKK
jgi:hypothetical protein